MRIETKALGLIVRVPPHQPILTWAVGGHGIEFMMFPRAHLPALIVALTRFVLDKSPNRKPFLA